MADGAPSHLLSLPPEIREQIYSIIFHPDSNRLSRRDEYTDYDYRAALVLFRLNQQIYYESRKVFRDLNVFVRIETPWAEAAEHTAIVGHVPIVMQAQRATQFPHASLDISVEAPSISLHREGEGRTHRFVILLDDLEAFTQSWFYSSLSNPGLNQFLSTKLHLRDPYTPDWEEKHIPRQVQRRMLAPFGAIKGSRAFTVTGDPAPQPSLVAAIEAEQRIPVGSPESALVEATRLKAEGNALLTSAGCDASSVRAALALYRRSWEAMYIVVKGRQRHVHAEAFFARELREPPYEGKNGQVERLALRIQLVANTCLAYLKLRDWDELRFWGMRTIALMRQATGANDEDDSVTPEDEALLSFPSAVQVGKIYYRTAVAWRELGDRAQARRLLRVAAVYLPHDNIVKTELAACALQIG
ncbi:Uu.00g139490.m01.CDS01 [Anthostomella pinea]|uniref:Uu.00g139490.m01.CDS01 n=1 Tax=Anthostomella pinea TaxID=933095 RepID=A0AAI8VQU0_9PEZI|nr:Uu.00g139490.m01.CDS01 [Anthostomella pinea]